MNPPPQRSWWIKAELDGYLYFGAPMTGLFRSDHTYIETVWDWDVGFSKATWAMVREIDPARPCQAYRDVLYPYCRLWDLPHGHIAVDGKRVTSMMPRPKIIGDTVDITYLRLRVDDWTVGYFPTVINQPELHSRSAYVIGRRLKALRSLQLQREHFWERWKVRIQDWWEEKQWKDPPTKGKYGNQPPWWVG